MPAPSIKIFNGKKYGLLGVFEKKPSRKALRNYGRTKVVRKPNGYAVYSRSHYADKQGLK